MYFHSNISHPTANGQMDIVREYDLLCTIHWCTILSKVSGLSLAIITSNTILISFRSFNRFYTLVPAGILLGLGAAPMWASKATYLTQCGQVYAKITDQAVDAIIVRFFGFFFLAWQTAELWGNLISSLVLSSGAHGGGSGGNSTFSETALLQCGANFCVVASAENANLERPPDSEIFEISTIYLACIVGAVLIIALLLDPLSR